ncbi:MAG TPA: GNAT family N-acetyltransferase, partial [Bradyrhizobium sp.]|nr:GNAT family N-acetyltransferase [Bradyrhizobium sp.]
MAEIADTTMARRASVDDVANAHARDGGPIPLAEIAVKQWRELSERAAEPNGYYLPDWELAVNASAPGRTNASTLTAR